MSETRQMRHPAHSMVPQRLINAILILLAVIVGLVAFARFTGMEPAAQPPRGLILSERVIHIEGNIAGKARVTDASGTMIVDLPEGSGVFISTVSRVIQRERQRFKADPNGPLHLRLREGNRLALFDPGTGRETELISFGKDNVAAFTRLLDAGISTPGPQASAQN